VSDRICNHPRAFGSSESARAARSRKPTPPGLIDEETVRTKVREWKRGWCFASDWKPAPVAGASAFAASLPQAGLIRSVLQAAEAVPRPDKRWRPMQTGTRPLAGL